MWVPSCAEFCSIRAPGILFRLFLSCLPFLPGLIQACSPMQGAEPTLPEKIHQHRAVWHGKILKTYPQNNMFGGGNVYTAEMSIYCIIKGPVVAKIVNITEAGFVPGHCHASTLEVGKSYIVLLYRYDETEEYKITDTEILPTEDNLKKVFSACGLEPKYPTGVSENTAEVRCHQPVTPCVAKEQQDMNPSDTAPVIGEPYDPSSEHSHDGHDHGLTTVLPQGHHEGDGHDHKGHHEGDGHDHKGHYEGDGHEHQGHYDADGNVNVGHKDGDRHDQHEHHEGDGHDHKGHYDTEGHVNEGHHEGDGHDIINGTKVEPVVAVSGKDGKDPKTGESHSHGTVSVLNINLLVSIVLMSTLSFLC